MTYVNCPGCGGRLLEAEEGSSVRLKCNKCGRILKVKIDDDTITLINETKREDKNK